MFEMSTFHDTIIEGGAGEKAPQLKACTALKGPGLAFQNQRLPVTQVRQDQTPSSGFCEHQHSCAHTQTQ